MHRSFEAMLFGICPQIALTLASTEVRQLTFVAPTVISCFPSPVIVILGVATNPAT